MDHEHLPGFVRSDPWHENRIVGPVPSRGWIDADITGIGALVETLAATAENR